MLAAPLAMFFLFFFYDHYYSNELKMCFESPKSQSANGYPHWLEMALLRGSTSSDEVRPGDSDLLCRNDPIVLLLNRRTEELRGWKDKRRPHVSDNSNNHGFYLKKRTLIKMTSPH